MFATVIRITQDVVGGKTVNAASTRERRGGRQSARGRATTWSLTSSYHRPVEGGNEENHPFTLFERLIETASVSTCKPLSRQCTPGVKGPRSR